ncbi:polyprenyl synthetase family protein [Chloroflexota bacterium]
MNLSHYSDIMLPAIEKELEVVLNMTQETGLEELCLMLSYHFGWEGPGAGPKARGKRIRPLLVLLTNAAAGGDWQKALPAAAAVEIVHNFSLIHDDIQDNSPLRRGRQTVWKLWGIPQAINAGDSLFALAHMALKRLQVLVPPEVSLQAYEILPRACLVLTQGQFLDLAYETRQELTTEDYWPMIQGKTASLLATCTELGSLVAQVDPKKQAAYRSFGKYVGLAFQVQDDILGIWGDAALTGKSADSDLLAGKKSLPVLHGLTHSATFAEKWRNGQITPEEVPSLAALLEESGALTFAQEKADELTQNALKALDESGALGDAKDALGELADMLIKRSA